MSATAGVRSIAEGLFEVTDGEPQLIVARCASCRELHFPASDTCPYCGDACGTERVGPEGRLRLYTVIHRAPPGYRGPVPYGFGVVALTGHRLEVIARLTEVDLARLRPNLPMRLEVVPLYTDDDGQVVLSWAFAPLEVAAPAGAS
jgi:uncharacterized OB-fold protein